MSPGACEGRFGTAVVTRPSTALAAIGRCLIVGSERGILYCTGKCSSLCKCQPPNFDNSVVLLNHLRNCKPFETTQSHCMVIQNT